MGLLHCPLCCHSEDQGPQYHDHSHHLQSESSTSSSLHSQQSLPSVPSLTPPSHPQQEVPQTTHQLLVTLKGHSCPISSLALQGKFLYSASSSSEILSWKRDLSALQALSSSNNVVAISNGAIKSLVFLGDKLFSAHQDNKIRVWKIQDNDSNRGFKCIATLPTLNDRLSKFFLAKNYVEVRRHKTTTWVHHVDTVSALALSRDGTLLYSASWDRTFKIWRTSDFKCLESVRNAHDDAINALVLSNEGFVYTGSADKKIKVWKKQAGEKRHRLLTTLEKHKSAVNALALGRDGSVLYSGACDRSILVWEKDNSDINDVGSMALVGALRGHTKAILCLVAAAAADLVCSGSADKSVRIWRRSGIVDNSYSCLAVLQGHTRPVKCLALEVDHNSDNNGSSNANTTSYLVYSGSLECDINVWKIQVPLF